MPTIRTVMTGQRKVNRQEAAIEGVLAGFRLKDKRLSLRIASATLDMDGCKAILEGVTEARLHGRNAVYLAFLLRWGDRITVFGWLSKYGLQGRGLGFTDPEPKDMAQREAEAENKLFQYEAENWEYF